jgi:hypothetical protein
MNSKTNTFTIYNTYEGLNIEDNTNINSTTSNLIRKLRKKINEINILKTRDRSLLNEAQKLKISKKGALLEQLQNELDKETSYVKKEKQKQQNRERKRKKEKTLKQLLQEIEKEQREHKAKEERMRNIKYKAYNERWKKRTQEQHKERKSQRQQHTCNVDVLNACKLFDININELNTTNLKKARRKLLLIHHPDKGGDETLTKEINNAYTLLVKYLEDYN